MSESRQALEFQTHASFTHRLVLSTLTGRPIKIRNIHADSPTNPGLAPHEVSFLRLLDAVTNGGNFEISYSGTLIAYRPGLITGSAAGSGASRGVVRHELEENCTRGVSYFLIPLCLLAPFSKAPFNVLFTGPGVITAATPAGDVSVDTVRTAILPLYERFGISNNIELRILRRSCAGSSGEGGAGEVQLVFGHQVRLPKTIHLLNAGRVKRIRGVAYCTGVSASNNARMIEAARGVLNPLAADTYIFSDVSSAPYIDSSKSSSAAGDDAPRKRKIGLGFGLSLVAESSTGALFSADVVSPPSGGTPPEDLGRTAAFQLLDNVSAGGCVSRTGALTMLTLMAMGSEDVGRLRVGRKVLGEAEEVIRLARDLSKFGASQWGLRDAGDNESEGEGDVVVSVVGRGIGNVGRKVA
ncbi:MAG: hypothetical protein M4579_007096 [Chaenotheca gracillima]|nr:MAG: hypothetical protein M4579_007096 [Chaenotheca gracillima]